MVARFSSAVGASNVDPTALHDSEDARGALPVLLGQALPHLLNKGSDSAWQSACHDNSPRVPVRELHLPFDGDVEGLCSAMHRAISETADSPSVVIVDMSQETRSFQTAASHLRALRRLVRLSPWPTACCIRVPALKPIDVIVALTCDIVFAEGRELQVDVGEQDELMRMARSHWRFFTGARLPECSLSWPLKGLALDAGRSPSVMLGGFLPHFWMSIRNMGMAASISQTTDPRSASHSPAADAGSCVERLKGAFNYILGPKMACLFAAWDAAQARHEESAVKIPAAAGERLAQMEKQQGTDAAAAWRLQQIQACVAIDRLSISEARVTFTSDVLLAHKDFVPQQCSSTLSQKAIKTIHVLLKDGVVADSRSIFPHGARSHLDLYKWHRRWEQFLTCLRGRHVVATMVGESVCPPLMELFFSADVRLWAASGTQVYWCKPPFAYTPGPEAAQGGLRKLPVALLRRLLLDGLPTTVAEKWGLINLQRGATLPKQEVDSQEEEGEEEGDDDDDEDGDGVPAYSDEDKVGSWMPLEDEPYMLQRASSHLVAAEVTAAGHNAGDLATTSETLGDFAQHRRRRQRSVTRSQALQAVRAMQTRTWQWGAGHLRLPEAHWRPRCEKGECSMIGYGLGNPGEEHRHSQSNIARLMGVPKGHPHHNVLTAPHIKTRYLAEMERDLAHPEAVDLKRLHEKHLVWSKKMLHDAIIAALADAGISGKHVGHVSITSSTGHLLPGMSAYVVQDKELRIPQSVSRCDIVGMGCHAGLNSLKSAAAWALANPGCYALACAVEVESAQYVWGDVSRKSLNNIVCNSLFGDGSFACVLHSAPMGEESPPPAYFDAPARWWTALCDTNALSDMIYEVEPTEGKYRFDLSELAPYHVSQGLFAMMHQALSKDIPVHYADHVVSHTGGQTILDNVATALGLEGRPEDTLPYTVGALRDYGNQSSCSFMFAFDKLVRSNKVRPGHLGLFVTMGPGAGLELALWTAGDRFAV